MYVEPSGGTNGGASSRADAAVLVVKIRKASAAGTGVTFLQVTVTPTLRHSVWDGVSARDWAATGSARLHAIRNSGGM